MDSYDASDLSNPRLNTYGDINDPGFIHINEGVNERTAGIENINLYRSGTYDWRSFTPTELNRVETDCLKNPFCDYIKFYSNRALSYVGTFSRYKDITPKYDPFSTTNIRIVKDKQKLCNTPYSTLEKPYVDFCAYFSTLQENQGRFDVFMNEFCKDYPTDSRCSCINSPIKKYGTTYNPLCVDLNCMKSGYATSSMLTANLNGCKIIDCTTVLDLTANKNININDFNITQNCGNTTDPNAIVQKSVIAPTLIVSSPTQNSSLISNSNSNLLIILGIIILILIIILIIFLII